MDTYMTVEEADEIVDNLYLDNEPEHVIWSSLTSEEKVRLMNIATSRIECSTLFLGSKLDSFQDLEYPRVYKGKVVEVPEVYKQAILTQGLSDTVSSSDDVASLASKGVKQYVVEGASVTFDNDANSKYERDDSGLFVKVRQMLCKISY